MVLKQADSNNTSAESISAKGDSVLESTLTTKAGKPVAGQIVWFGALFILAATLVFGAVVLAADALRTRLARSARAQRGLNRAAALVFVGLAARLALAQR